LYDRAVTKDVATLTVGVAGLGYWGPNLARNLDDLPAAELEWLCDLDEARLATYGTRFPRARVTTRFEDLLADPRLDAVAIATPVTTHYRLAKQALVAGKHVFVEKPLAVSGDRAEELVVLAEERQLVLMPGHLLLYHPGVAKLAELLESGELGRILYVYGNRQNLGQIRSDENALWSLGAHDLSVILHLVREEPVEAWARGESYLREAVEDVVFCFLRFPSGVVAHMHLSWLDPHKIRRITVVGDRKMAVFDDMELDRKVTVYDKAAEQRTDTYGEWRTRTGDISIPKVQNDEPLRLECEHFLALVRGDGQRLEAAHEGLAVVRTLEQLQRALERERV
jgi:predicted dehydrogenase